MSEKNPRRQFLKNTGIAALASSLAGVSSLQARSSALPAAVDCSSTTLDLYGQGPFYTANAPTLTDNFLASGNETGMRLVISGRVVSINDCMAVIPNTILDIWHANDAGAYDNNGYNLRGKVLTNSQGYYVFETILPGKYLNGARFRPSHIHFKITPPGFPTLITQLYFEGDTDIPADAAASVSSGTYDASFRIIPLAEGADGKLQGTWDIYIQGDGVNGLPDLHLDKGIIYTLSPNPFRDSVVIHYGVFQRAMISLTVHDMLGREVAVLEKQELTPDKYTAVWQPSSDLAAGHYFVALKINALQVHYLRVLRQ